MLLFLPPVRLLPHSDWTIFQGELTSDCYLCVMRHRTAEQNNTLPLVQPSVHAHPSRLASSDCSSTFDPLSPLFLHSSPLPQPSYCPSSPKLLPMLPMPSHQSVYPICSVHLPPF